MERGQGPSEAIQDVDKKKAETQRNIRIKDKTNGNLGMSVRFDNILNPLNNLFKI